MICSGVDKVAHYDFLSHKYIRTHVVNDDILPKIRTELLIVLYFIVKLKNMFNSQLKKIINYVVIRHEYIPEQRLKGNILPKIRNEL